MCPSRTAWLALVLCACSAPPSTPHGEGLARQLLSREEYDWQTRTEPFGHIHYLKDSHAEKTADSLAEQITEARATVLKFIGESETGPPSELFFVDSRGEMQRLIGRPLGGMVKSGEKVALFVYGPGYAPFLKHELTHLYTHYSWGQPRGGRWISEGIATLVTGPCQGHSVDQLAAGLMQGRQMKSWRELQTEFDVIPEVPANVQAASMTAFILQTRGMDALKYAWDGDSTFVGLERDWLDQLGTAQPAELDINWLIERGCSPKP